MFFFSLLTKRSHVFGLVQRASFRAKRAIFIEEEVNSVKNARFHRESDPFSDFKGRFSARFSFPFWAISGPQTVCPGTLHHERCEEVEVHWKEQGNTRK